jgi:V/A-type H+-transporting ATPase subunit I
MKLRSRPTRWFEVFVPREQVVYALESLAGTHSIELEVDPRFSGTLKVKALAGQLRKFDTLAQRYRRLLPESTSQATRLLGNPEDVAKDMLQRLQQWATAIDPLLEKSARLKAQRDQLSLLEQASMAMGERASQLAHLAHTGDLLFKGLYACPSEKVNEAAFKGMAEHTYRSGNRTFLILASLPEQRDQALQQLSKADCRTIAVPSTLPAQPEQQREDIRRRLQQVQDALDEVKEEVQALRRDPRMAEAMANINTLRWFTGAAHQVGVEDARFCHITGWTSETDAEHLQTVLNNAHVEAEVRLAQPPRGIERPVPGVAGWWKQPFQVFTAMWGAPGANEVDPTGLLAFVVPLLFGYMFPDTGHGLVIALAGILLSRHLPKSRFLITCGAAAMIFGILFDDFFGYAMLNQPWQIHALEDPVLVLILPMFFGVGLLLLGLIFNGIEAYWRGELGKWTLSDMAVLALYICLLLSVYDSAALLGAAVALVWYLIGAAVIGRRRWASQMGIALGTLAHSTLTLIMNTISFVRVGAFALAHGGLSLVVVTLASAVDNHVLALLLSVLGHIVIIALEGLVVFVQTTRLVLFEFFMQFLRARGRFFQPLAGAGRSHTR